MDPLFAAVIFVFGLAFGSFLNVCIHRVPRRIDLLEALDQARNRADKLRAESAQDDQLTAALTECARLQREVDGFSVVQPESACPKCHHAIRAYDNIPVVSWLVLGGRCRYCKAPITPRYIAVELLTGLLFAACYWQFGLSLATLKYCIFSFLIVGLTFIDAEWKLLPDVFTIPGLFLGLLFSLWVPMLDMITFLLWGAFPGHFEHMPRLMSVIESAGGACVGAAFFYFVAIAYQYARGREGMGLGDVKLMAMVGAFLGVRLTMVTIFGASLIGSLFGLATILTVWKRRTERRMTKCREPREVASKRAWKSAKLMYRYHALPFGVFLGPMSLVALFIGPSLLRWYWGLY